MQVMIQLDIVNQYLLDINLIVLKDINKLQMFESFFYYLLLKVVIGEIRNFVFYLAILPLLLIYFQMGFFYNIALLLLIQLYHSY